MKKSLLFLLVSVWQALLVYVLYRLNNGVAERFSEVYRAFDMDVPLLTQLVLALLPNWLLISLMLAG